MKKGHSNIVFLLCALVFMTLSMRIEARGDLVWSLRVSNGVANLEHNDFNQNKIFPVDNVRIKRIVNNSNLDEHGRLAFDQRLEVAPLSVDLEGRINGGEKANLIFYNGANVSAPLPGLETAILGQPNDPISKSDFPISYINFDSSFQNQEVIMWEKLPGTDFGVVHTKLSTNFFTTDHEVPPGSIPFPFYLRGTWGAVISVESRRLAAFTYGEEKKGPKSSGIVVFDFEGIPVFETDFVKESCEDLYMDPQGNYLVFSKKGPSNKGQTIIMGIPSQQEKALSVPYGFRYYSADGKNMLVMQPGFRKAYYFDNSDPWNPVKLWDYETDETVVTGAVSFGGEFIALQILDVSSNPSRIYKRVVVLDSSGEEISYPIISGSQKQMDGLQWEDNYLFVGVQHHPLPTGVHYRSTDRVNVYDFTE